MRRGSVTAARRVRVSSVAVAAIVVAATVSAQMRGDRAMTPPIAIAHEALIYLLPLTFLLVLSGLLAWRAETGRERFTWVGMTLTFGSLLAAEVIFSGYELFGHPDGPPSDHPVILLYLIAILSFASVIIRITRSAATSPWRHVRRLVDAAAGVWALIPVCYWLWTMPLLSPIPGARPADAVLAALYPVIGLFMLGSTVIVVGDRSPRLLTRWEWLFIVSLWVFAGSLFTYPHWRYLVLTTAGPAPLWYSELLAVGFVVFGMSLADRLATTRPSQLLDGFGSLPPALPRWMTRLYPIAVTGVLVWTGFTAIRYGRTEWGVPLVTMSVVLSVLLTARSSLTALEAAAYQRIARTDPETGARIRSMFDAEMTDAILVARDSHTPLTLVIMDCATDPRVDTVLAHFADPASMRTALDAARNAFGIETCYHVGSYRFAFILESTTGGQAQEAAREVLWRVAAGTHRGTSPDIAFGIVEVPDTDADLATMVGAAHDAADDARSLDEPIVVHEARASQSAEPPAEERQPNRAVRDALVSLAHAVDARDPFSGEHSANVSDLARGLSQILGYTDSEIAVISFAALVHDIGKVGVADEILFTGSRLTPQEYERMHEHPVLGARILGSAHLDEEVLAIVRHHHENWDGSGYPDGLAGDEIPRGARVVAVCDVFEAMTSPLPWRDALSAEAAIAQIEASLGTRFDPEIGGAFIRMIGGLGSVRR